MALQQTRGALVVGDDDIELTGIGCELICTVVSVEVLQFDIRKLPADFRDHFPPEDSGLHHICLVGRDQFLFSPRGQFKSNPCVALDFLAGIQRGVYPGLVIAFQFLDAPGFTKERPATQLPKDDDVCSPNGLRPKGG